MDVGIHSCVEILVAWHRRREVGVKHHLVEDRVVAIHTELQPGLGIRHYTGARCFRACSRNCGHRDFVDGRNLHQIPALIVGRRTSIGEQIGDRFGGIHGGATTEPHDCGRRASE